MFVSVFPVIHRITQNVLSALGNSFVFFTRVCWLILRDYGSWSRSPWLYLQEERIFHIHRSRPDFLSWGFEPATLHRQNDNSRYKITFGAYKCGALICLSWVRLLLLTHYLSFQAYTTIAAITAIMAFSETLRIDSFTWVLLHFR